jgi:hypothetical protein
MLNAGKLAVAAPSVTLIRMLECIPTFAIVGVPERAPVEASNEAHDGWFVIEKVSGSPFSSFAIGAKLYCVPGLTAVPGVPEIVGALFAAVFGGLVDGGLVEGGLADGGFVAGSSLPPPPSQAAIASVTVTTARARATETRNPNEAPS